MIKHSTDYGTPDGTKIKYKIARGCYRVVEWRGERWMPIARDMTYAEACALVKGTDV